MTFDSNGSMNEESHMLIYSEKRKKQTMTMRAKNKRVRVAWD